ncbi:hypothetical protein JOF57_005382 [Mycolicibacterium lutetiense]|uniref:Uncharacterized protein n=1 Tax=Mycolicibacterium lutetiense TaxID=1641992 RepID=A0ABS5A3M2_9MYCO|nr:hypothetical protein [Mycolicibacterium lutetiense]
MSKGRHVRRRRHQRLSRIGEIGDPTRDSRTDTPQPSPPPHLYRPLSGDAGNLRPFPPRNRLPESESQSVQACLAIARKGVDRHSTAPPVTCSNVVRRRRRAPSRATRIPHSSKYPSPLVTAPSRLPAKKLLMIGHPCARSSSHPIQRSRHLLHCRTAQSRCPRAAKAAVSAAGTPQTQSQFNFCGVCTWLSSQHSLR